MTKGTFIRKLGQSTSPLVIAPVTLFASRWYFRALFELVKAQQLAWGAKKACVTISFDCDTQEDLAALPQLLRLLERYPFETSFACIGKWIERYPDVHRAIVAAGHEISNHTYSHPNNDELQSFERFNELTAAEQETEIVRCHEVCQRYLNYAPVGFRIPHFGALYTPTIYPILQRLNYRYSSSMVAAKTATGGAPFRTAQGIWEFPVSPCPAHPFGVFDTHHAFRKKRAWHQEKGAFFALFQELLQLGMQSAAHINLYFDPRDVVLYDDFPYIFDLLRERQTDIHVLSYREIITHEQLGMKK